MELYEIDAYEYSKLIENTDTPIYNKTDFLELNKSRVDRIHYLLGKDKRNRLTLAIGEIDGEWKAPFSAPFSNIIPLRKDITLENLYDFISQLVEYVRKQNGKRIDLYFPANIYDEHLNSRVMNALLGCGFSIQYEDVNYSFDLENIDVETYDLFINSKARNKLRIALKSGITFIKCENNSEIEEAYDVIAENRASKGYPLRMSKELLLETLSVVNHDCFLVKINGESIASAVVYRITSNVAQVIYWGDKPGFTEYKPINFLAYRLIEYYKNLEFMILDVGISTDKGVPNFGLCNFKESIGCNPSSKFRFIKIL